jgi:hypothetical protein
LRAVADMQRPGAVTSWLRVSVRLCEVQPLNAAITDLNESRVQRYASRRPAASSAATRQGYPPPRYRLRRRLGSASGPNTGTGPKIGRLVLSGAPGSQRIHCGQSTQRHHACGTWLPRVPIESTAVITRPSRASAHTAVAQALHSSGSRKPRDSDDGESGASREAPYKFLGSVVGLQKV